MEQVLDQCDSFTDVKTNFFHDLHGIQCERAHNFTYMSKYRVEAERIRRHFMSNNDETSLKCILLLQILRKLLRKTKIRNCQDNGEKLNRFLVKLLKHGCNSAFGKIALCQFPSKTRAKFKEAIEYIQDYLPDDFFKKWKKKIDNLTKYRITPEVEENTEPLFWISLRNQQTDDSPTLKINLQDYAPPASVLNGTIPNRKFSLFQHFLAYSDKVPAFNYNNFADKVAAALESPKSDEDLINELLDTFGCELFDLVKNVISHRYGYIDFSSPLDIVDKKTILAKKNHIRTTPAMASQVIVQSEEEKNLAKRMRKQEKKDKNRNGDEYEMISEEYDDVRLKPIFARTSEAFDINDYPHIHDQKFTKVATTVHKGSSVKLPENAVQKKTNEFVEINIPAATLNSNEDNYDLVKVEDLDLTGKMVFKDIKQFNRIQSEVFPVAYGSNENMLICAPTGAGKTNIALLAIVHQIKLYMVDNMLANDNFKIVYVCPMKALATEMVTNFSKKLSAVGISVKELTGEMQLTKKQISSTHMLVTTPEKLDVITRKGAVDTEVISQLKLLIIDEVHLLNGSRGPVIETIVARTLRHVISAQSMIRIVALSATLPGYLDVANFLRVNPRTGLFFFDNRFRSVPLSQTYIGVTPSMDTSMELLNKISYQKVKPFVKDGHQVMVFVTARNQTMNVANSFITLAQNLKELDLFEAKRRTPRTLKTNFKTANLRDLVSKGFGIHHAGMCRSDRLEIESLFREGLLKVIVCTATLAWGVNLPAHAVIIRGTSLYDPQQSKFVDLDILDILQIFGRAGRPQYDSSGHAVLITSGAKMSTYMNLLMSQTPIESKFLEKLPDNLNGEIVLGTISNMREALDWLRNTYLFHRLKKNPLNYGLSFAEVWDEDKLYEFLQRNLESAAKTLEKAEMIRYTEELGELRATSYGRIASFLYISYQTIMLFLERMKRHMTDTDIFSLICSATEFQQIQVRNDELEELDRLRREYVEVDIGGEVTTVETKVMILIQTSISRGFIKVSSLASDCEYIMQNIVRVAMALNQLAIEKNFAALIERSLIIAQMLEQRTWHFLHPLQQFKDMEFKGMSALSNINIPVEELRQMNERDIANMTRNSRMANKVLHCAKAFPKVDFDVIVKPITEGVIRLKLLITPDFKWDNNIHGAVQHFNAFVEDPTYDSVYHIEKFIITERTIHSEEPIELVFTIPLTEPHSNEYFVKIVNCHFLHTEVQQVIDLENVNMLPSVTVQTKFLNVQPLPTKALRNSEYESIYPFSYFNAVQSQVFFCCYNTDSNVLLGAPTGSGKTIVSELCILRLFTKCDNRKVVYIAPMKALVRERVKDWTPKFKKINKNVVEITGDVTPKSELISSANIIITTPEKWDGMSRNWHQKDFVKQVGLVIIDEIHLLAEERGPVLEVIVSRMNYINSFSNAGIRIIGLSTAMANAGDLANWLDIKRGLFNFSSAVRPVPLEIHVTGFPGKNYCPRMATMNKPAFQAICQYAPNSPVLIFVSSRKQTRITSHELIKMLVGEANPKQWLHCTEEEIELYRKEIVDNDLSYLLMFGIGIHHAGLQEKDRDMVEELFVNQKIQVLVATATLAWGVNFPAHLVIVKGTEYFDGATKRYVDMPVTDVLQMLGRAGRPQYDTQGVACVFVEESKKNFYRKFLFEPFPVESSLIGVLPDHVNAEVSNGTIAGKAQLIDFICSTFFFRRLLVNPVYYQQGEIREPQVFLDELADSVAETLKEANCITIIEDDQGQFMYEPTYLGLIAAKYYLSYKTMVYFDINLNEESSIMELLLDICNAEEYALFPVRHNEDKINRQLVDDLKVKTRLSYDSPHLKVFLLVYCYITGVQLPNQEYVIDLKTVFDQIIRIIQAMISLTVHKGWLDCTIKLIYISQMVIQGLLLGSSSVLMLPHINEDCIEQLTCELQKQKLIEQELTVPILKNLCSNFKNQVSGVLAKVLNVEKAQDVLGAVNRFPLLDVKVKLRDVENDSQLEYNVNKNEMYLECEVKAGIVLSIVCDIRRTSSRNTNVYTKNFSKQKDESWFIMTVVDDCQIVDHQRLTFKNNKFYEVQINTPYKKGVYKYTLQLMSDSYIGLDERIDLKISVV